MEKLVLIVGGLLKTFELSDLFFFIATLVLILLLVYIIYLIKCDEEMNIEMELPIKTSESKSKTLEEIVNILETDYEAKPIDLSAYEKEQEDTAIISYDELLKRSTNNIKYEDSYDSGLKDITVRKVDATNTSNTVEHVNLPKAVMMSYDNEEAFLKALKVLQKNLVR